VSAQRFRAALLPSRSRGLAAVELALVVPLFMFLMIGTEELARALYQYNTLTKAVRDSAQYLARNAVTPAGVVSITDADELAAENLVKYGNPTGEGSKLLPNFGEGASGASDTVVAVAVIVAPSLTANYVTVTATYAFRPLLGLIPAFGAAGDVAAPGTFSASATMRGL
jgi:Flp pilus assembly protein TadG